ncbi:Glucuronoxylan 4-O-methyltransferase 1 [Quillaja saponaria]|uniref:Glucuronoxylan 4-O-methyltransferase 1 n=1 Tax=Quillaja saponaria TaxID=32244 RepID=A0AAD7LEP9_QUISA|nr:Glucuronoxylan 4-O-methyltransferase 1 [Quillaja saponaria]
MPPEVTSSCSLLTPLVQFSPPVSSQAAQQSQASSHKRCQGNKRMNVTVKKLIPVLVLILTVTSILRLLRLAISTSFPSPPLHALPPSLQHNCSPNSSTCRTDALHAPGSSNEPTTSSHINFLTEKEFKLLARLIAKKSPCNLLVFGLQSQYLTLSSINEAGTTIFLEDDPEKISTIKTNSNGTQIYKVQHNMPAKEAYNQLKHARQNPACAPNSGLLQESKCQLALKKLPEEVYAIKWDVIVVDGPNGDSPESPGRMAAIYSASLIARAGNITDVLVHDADRTIEKWFSWEFLCDENLLSSKGRLWHFRIKGELNSTRFCPAEALAKE